MNTEQTERLDDRRLAYLDVVDGVLMRLNAALEPPRNLELAWRIKQEIDPWDALEGLRAGVRRLRAEADDHAAFLDLARAAWLREKSRADRLQGEVEVLRAYVAQEQG